MDALGAVTEEEEREADGFLTGLAVAIVTDNEDPDGLARVRVRLPWQDESDFSYWARTAMPMAGTGRGTYFLPEVGDEVLVGAENGDPSHLYVLGALWNGKDKPPATNSDGKNNERVIFSRSGHVLRFIDDDAKPQVELSLTDGKRLLLDNDGATVEDGNGNVIKIDSTSNSIEVTAGKDLSLKAAKVSIEASGSMDIKASGTLTLKGAMVQIN